MNNQIVQQLYSFDGISDYYPQGFNINNGVAQLYLMTTGIIVQPKNYLYGLFYLIRESYLMNIDSFFKTFFEWDIFGFTSVKRNTRVSIEAFIDIFNLRREPNYIYIMKKGSKLDLENEEEMLYVQTMKRYFPELSIPSLEYISFYRKVEIAKVNGMDSQLADKLLSAYKTFNCYTHPNVFVSYDFSSRNEEVKHLIFINIYLIHTAFDELSESVLNGNYNIDVQQLYQHTEFKRNLLVVKNDLERLIYQEQIFEEVNINMYSF